MANLVITPTNTFAMCTLKIQKGVIDNIDRARKQCIWRGNNTDKKGGNLAAWPLVIKLKNKGGLGVLNLRLQNDALLKHLHKFYSRQDIPWVNLIWTTYYTDKVPHASREVGSFWWKDVTRLDQCVLQRHCKMWIGGWLHSALLRGPLEHRGASRLLSKIILLCEKHTNFR
jgi:hypothetical protein